MGKPFTAERLANIRRMRKARRLFKKQPLFAFHILRNEYPDYTHSDFLDDLRYRSKPKRRKPKSALLRYGRYFRMLDLQRKYDATKNVEYAIQAQKLRRYMTRPYRVMARICGGVWEYSFSALIPIEKIEAIVRRLPQCQSMEDAQELVEELRQNEVYK